MMTKFENVIMLASATMIISGCALLCDCDNGFPRKGYHSVCLILPSTDLSQTCLSVCGVCSLGGVWHCS